MGWVFWSPAEARGTEERRGALEPGAGRLRDLPVVVEADVVLEVWLLLVPAVVAVEVAEVVECW